MKILSGDTISYYLGYLEKKHKEYFREYYSVTRFNEPYDPYYDDIKSDNVSANFIEFDRTLSRIYLDDVSKIVDKVFDNCKYLYNSTEFINLKLSLVLSLVKDEIVTFHLDEEHYVYLRLLIILFYSEVKEVLEQESVYERHTY